MTANQRKKRVNAASLVGCTSYEQYMVKRKKLKLPRPTLKMAPTISLEWDNKKKSVVSKRDQIGISQRHWIQLTEPGPHSHNILADVFSVPQEIFELENLSEVLSYEVWQSLLSKCERSLLSQFLPKEAEPDTLVQELLAGNNFHFGNPFLLWGASLCFGELHPDNVLHEEQTLKACKKAYNSHLRKYHKDMIGNLQLWKEKWASCEDPDVDIVHKVWRTRNYAEKSVPLSDGIYDAEENLVGTPDSCSCANSEKEYDSDNQNWEMLHVDSDERKLSLNKTCDSGFSRQEVAAVSRKGGKLHKHNIQHEDGAKYMSYVKVSKQQHERVKSSMKHAGLSIQHRSLNNVLGTTDTLNVQPFEKFEEEEEKKLHDHWLKLVKRDIPDGFIYWRKSHLSRQQLIRSLGEEMGRKVTLDGDTEGSPNKLMEQSDDSKYEFLPAITIERVEKDQFADMLSEQRDTELAIDEIETVQQAETIRKTAYVFEDQTHDTVKIEHGDIPEHVCIKDHHHQQQVASIDKSSMHSGELIESCNPFVPQDKHQQQNGSVNGNLQIKSLEMECLVSSATAETDDTPTFSTNTGNVSRANIPVNHRVAFTPASDVWPTGDTHGSYYQPAVASDGYVSSQALKLERTQLIREQPLQILDMETRWQDKDAGKDVFPGRSGHTSFFSSYTNQDQSEPLSFFKGHNSLSYQHEQKHAGVDFQSASDTMDAGQYHGHLTEQVHPSLHLYPKPKRLNDFYMHQTLQEGLCSDGRRFNMPRQEQVPVNIHSWAAVNSVSMTTTSQPHLNSIELNQNWYSGDGGAQDVWAPYESAVHSFSGGRNSDQSLFSVLSECNELRPAVNYDPMSSSGRFIQAGNYGGLGEGIPPSSLPQEAPNEFNYLNGHEAGSAGVRISNLGWMGIPQQNPGIYESSMGKPFLRSWNQ